MTSEHSILDVRVSTDGGNEVEELCHAKPPKQNQDESTNEFELNYESEKEISVTQDKKRKKQTSDVWSYFDDLGMCDDENPRAKCKGCGESYVAGGAKYGTSTLTRHLGKCKGIKSLKLPNIPEIFIDQQGKLRSKKIDQKIFRNLVALSIIKHDLPFAYVEYDGVREVWKYINPEIKFFSRTTAVSDV